MPRWKVYMKRIQIDINSVTDLTDWKFMGETIAKTEEQAISFVRYRKWGKKHTSNPRDAYGDVQEISKWKAEEQ